VTAWAFGVGHCSEGTLGGQWNWIINDGACNPSLVKEGAVASGLVDAGPVCQTVFESTILDEFCGLNG
jgi:hypothetical protein